MEIREAKIKEIKNLNLIYIFSTDSVFKNNTNKYIGVKVVYNDKEVINIDYKDKFFDVFITKILDQYNKEKDKKSIILLGELTKKLINGSSFSILEKKNEIKETSSSLPLFEVDNRNLQKYNEALKEVLKLIISLNMNYDNLSIDSINGYNNHYMVTYKAGKITKEFPMILYNNGEQLYFRLNRIQDINTNVFGSIYPEVGKLTVKFNDNAFSGTIIYDSENDIIEKRVDNELGLVYYDDSKEMVYENDINLLKFYFNLLGYQLPNNIIKLGKNSYLLSNKTSIIEDEDILYTTETYLVSITDKVIVNRTTINGISKYDNQINVVLDKEVEENSLKNILIDNKSTIINEKKYSTNNKNIYSYLAYEVDRYFSFCDIFEISNCYELENAKTISGVKEKIMNERRKHNGVI